MPSPEVIDLTLSDDEIQPDPIRSDQGTSTPTQATNRFRTSSSTPPPPPHPASTELEEFFQSFKVLLVRLLPSPLTTETSLKGCFPHPSLKLETF